MEVVAMNAPQALPTVTVAAASRAGRPTRAQAEARHAELLEAALDHFLDKGFELATVEAIANSVNMTKRTVYARYPEKVALFRAAVARAIAQVAVSPEQMQAALSDDLETTLVAIARLRVDPVSTPAGLKLQRIIQTESYRFPDIFTLSFEQGALPVIRFLGELLARETAAGRLAVDEPMLAANLFISMIVTGPIRILTAGIAITPEEIDHRIRYAVRLFLDGARRRPG